jgi:hypothetical protein
MIRKLLPALLIGGLAFALLQLAFARPANPAAHSAAAIEASLSVPAPVEAILNQACKDCHSQETVWPWYSRVPPVSWVVAGDVERGRRALNFSEWAARHDSSPGVAIGYLTAACADVESQRMPPPAYRRMHPAARLSAAQVRTLCDWTAAETRSLSSQKRRPRHRG